MEGTTILGADGAVTAIIITFSDELKRSLRNRFVAFCYGSERASEEVQDDGYYSIESTVEEFFSRFDTKKSETQIGMIGELLMHLLHPHTHADLLGAAVYFNKEERNIKKGFDLSFLETEPDAVWYGEVKSGAVRQDQSADAKSHALLMHGARDLHDKLINHERSRWDSALLDADLTLASAEARSVKKLLRTDSVTLKGGAEIVRRAFLGSVTFHNHQESALTDDGTRASMSSIVKGNKFNEVRVLAIQHVDMDDITAFIREGLVVDDANAG